MTRRLEVWSNLQTIRRSGRCGGLAISSLELLVGIAAVAVVLFDVFETVVVPRRTDSLLRLAPHLLMGLWPLWRRLGMRKYPAWRREDFLGTFAPFAIVSILLTWVSALIFGFGLVLHALGNQIRPPIEDYQTAFYLAGTSLFTIGFGDYVPVGGPARLAALMAGGAGLAVMALVISLAFNLYGSFARREVLVLILDSRAGAPPSGLMLLETFARHDMQEELADTLAQFELWTAEMLDSHLAYPILPFFRSSHDNQSWVSALGAVLDAATLLTTAVRKDCDSASSMHRSRACAEMMYHIGCHALVDLTQMRMARRHLELDHPRPGIERAEFETACRRLAAVGYATECSDESWQAFSDRRSVYSNRLNALARYFASPPTQWIGDRTVLSYLDPNHLRG